MMWSGAYGSTHKQYSGARWPGFDSHPNPDCIYGKLSSTLFQTTDIKMNLFICNIVLSSWNKYYYIIIRIRSLKNNKNILLVFNLTLSIVYFLPSWRFRTKVWIRKTKRLFFIFNVSQFTSLTTNFLVI
jgi:hypothetical protein